MADQAGMRGLDETVAALADDPEPPGVFGRGSYRRLRAGTYQVLYEVEGDVIVIVRVDRAEP
ncbi:MAG TPA: type II toxin-antitoxin system RelE/ParE family toxin [Streptosporangiaceae bacterium]|jgi:mRNA-degrading endonuclease RelE of RelBE toxin-antitoxin system